MKKVIKVAGLDPSLSNFGVAIGEIELDSGALQVNKLHLIETKAGDTKKQVRVNSDDMRRLNEIWRGIKPLIDQVHLVFCELPVPGETIST
ncbi:hypothetical protein HVX25_24510 (plasmid) [Escherichia coli]|nr:hypothetical protein HVX25_24510 [Escherichia coli]QMO20522.1 hypothetical protein HVW50_24160 [Escherichia coli]